MTAPMDFLEVQEGMTVAQEYLITKEIYSQFLAAFGDENQLHIDEDYAVSRGFAGKVMHGAILNGFISHFLGMVFPARNVIIQSVQIDFKNPNYQDDKLQLRMTVAQKSEAVRTVVLKFEFYNATQNYVTAKGKVQAGFLEKKA